MRNPWYGCRQIVSDTAWEGYEAVPRQVMAGYSVIGSEVYSLADASTSRHLHIVGARSFVQFVAGTIGRVLLAM